MRRKRGCRSAAHYRRDLILVHFFLDQAGCCPLFAATASASSPAPVPTAAARRIAAPRRDSSHTLAGPVRLFSFTFSISSSRLPQPLNRLFPIPIACFKPVARCQVGQLLLQLGQALPRHRIVLSFRSASRSISSWMTLRETSSSSAGMTRSRSQLRAAPRRPDRSLCPAENDR